MKTIDKLKKSDKLEIHAKILFDVKNSETFSLDRQTAEKLIVSVVNDMFRKNMNLFDKIDMEFVD
jgi:heme oxygenase